MTIITTKTLGISPIYVYTHIKYLSVWFAHTTCSWRIELYSPALCCYLLALWGN